MARLELLEIKRTVSFILKNSHPKFKRVTGARWDPDNEHWVFPAYSPFAVPVLQDLQQVDPQLEFSPEARAHALKEMEVPGKITRRELPPLVYEGTALPPYDHQREALAHVFYNPRFGLLYEAGLGKSKILIDLLRLLPGHRMLVLTPSITVNNWIDEIKIHSNDTLKAVALTGTVKRKRKRLAAYADYDVIVCSYGTARTMGFPFLTKPSVKALLQTRDVSEGSKTDNGVLNMQRIIKYLPTQAEQYGAILAWCWGMSMAEIERQVQARVGQKAEWLEQISFDIIVADESHNIQEGSSIQTQVAIALSKKAYRRYISSGTAILGDPRDIYTQAKFLSPAVITEDWLSFESNHLVKSKWNKHQVVGYKNMDILNRRIGRVSISRTKDECLDLPDRSIIDVKVPMSAEQIVAYNMLVDAQNTSLTLLMNNEEVALQTQTAVTRLQKLAQVTSGFLYEPGAIKALCDGCPHLTNCVAQKIQPYTQACHIEKEEPQRQTRFFKENPRLERLEELVDSIFQTPDAKVIIWAWYEAELTQIKDLFERRKWKYHTPGGDTQSKIREFNTTPEIRAWVAQEATGVGITLNAAQYMIYYSAGFSLGHYLQSIDRNYRIGQKNKVIVYRFVADGTIDEYKLQALDQKKDLSTMLTKKLSCATCSKRANCLTNNIELFEPGCIYQKTSTKIVVKAERIENDEDNLGE